MRISALFPLAFSLASICASVQASHVISNGHKENHRNPIRAVDAYSPQSLNPKLRSVPLYARDLPIGTCNKDTPCTNKACCGPDGLCGYSPKSCGNGCSSNCDAKAQCGQYAPADSQKCPLNVCCSEFGYCGSTDDFCKWKGCDPKYVSFL